jgi:hypothetical protein
MEKVKSWIRSPGKKRIVILAAGVGIIGIFVILYVTMQSRPPASEVLAPTPSYMPKHNGEVIDNSAPTNAVVTVDPQNGIPKWKSYEGSSYILAVPPDWSAHPRLTVNGGGDMVIVRPDILPSGVNSPEFIFYSNLDAGTLQQKVSILKGLGFKESKITVLGKSASKFSGTLSSSMVGNQRIDKPIQVTDVYLIQGDKLYVFSYQYDGTTQSKLLEDYFTEIINGVRIK